MADNSNLWKQVLDKVNIVDVISEYCNLQKRGKNYTANCPFHTEDTPSFVVSPEKQIFTCFGCKKAGNAIKFLEYQLNISSFEALTRLAKQVNVDVSKYQKFESNVSEEQTQLYEVTEAASNYFQYQFHAQLKAKNQLLINFVKKREINPKILNHFRLGFSPKEISAYKYLIDKGFDEKYISKISVSSSNDPTKNFFNDRLMFPIYDQNINCVGFSGRTADNDEVKYLNTSENEIFKKNSVFFNWNNVKYNLQKNKEIYLVEGQFDVVALYRIGIENALAVMGTNLTENHLALLKNCTINLFFDGDNAGQQATLKNLKIILKNLEKYSLKVNVVNNETTADPDELYFQLPDGKALKTIIKNRLSHLDFIYKITFDNPEYEKSLQSKSELLNRFQEFLGLLKPAEQDLLKEQAIKQNKLSLETFEQYKQNTQTTNLINLNSEKTVSRKKSSLPLARYSKKYGYYQIIKTCVSQPYLVKEMYKNLELRPDLAKKFSEAVYTQKTRKEDVEKTYIRKIIDYIKKCPDVEDVKLEDILNVSAEEFQEIFENLAQTNSLHSSLQLFKLMIKEEADN